MKTVIAVKKMTPVFFLLFFIFSCNNAAEVKSTAKDDKPTPEAKKEEPTKKDNPPGDEKGMGNWNANESAAQIKFSVKGPFGTVNGSLGGLRSTILFDKDKLDASSIRASVDTRSISTGIKLRNSDLQKEKYFNSEKYPSISFRSDKIQASGNGYKAIGELTIKGVTKHVEIPFSFTEKGSGGVFRSSFTIQRQDYGIGKAGGSIGNTVNVNLEVPVTK